MGDKDLQKEISAMGEQVNQELKKVPVIFRGGVENIFQKFLFLLLLMAQRIEILEGQINGKKR